MGMNGSKPFSSIRLLVRSAYTLPTAGDAVMQSLQCTRAREKMAQSKAYFVR
jgi:hypothetical protein